MYNIDWYAIVRLGLDSNHWSSQGTAMTWFWKWDLARLRMNLFRSREAYRNKSCDWKQEKDKMNRDFGILQKAEGRQERRVAQANFLAVHAR